MNAAIVVFAVAFGFVLPTTAAAADPPQTYVVPVCSTANGPHPLAGWTPLTAASVDGCTLRNGFGGSPGSTGVGWDFHAPDDTEVAAIRVWRTGVASESAGYAFYAWGSDGADPTMLERTGELRDGAVDGKEFGGLRATRLVFEMWCCQEAGDWVRFTRMELVMRDVVNPRVTGLAGPALAGTPIDGSTTVRASFADVGGGVRDLTLLVDGAVYVRLAPRCAQPYASAVPCPLIGTAELPLNTRSLADGHHTLAVEVTDVAGNRSIGKSYDVQLRPPPIAPVATTAPTPAVTLTPEWATVAASYGQHPVVQATVRDAAGTRLAGLKVGVAVRQAALGAPFVLDTPLFSDAQGRVALQLGQGTSREIKFTYGDQVAIVKVVVKAPLRFSASPKTTRNGDSIRLAGSVPGTIASTAVELQARSGTKWIPFKTVRLHDGRFSAQYRFLRTFQTTRYRFRAVIHGDAHFPYAAAPSRIATVVVRP